MPPSGRPYLGGDLVGMRGPCLMRRNLCGRASGRECVRGERGRVAEYAYQALQKKKKHTHSRRVRRPRGKRTGSQCSPHQQSLYYSVFRSLKQQDFVMEHPDCTRYSLRRRGRLPGLRLQPQLPRQLQRTATPNSPGYYPGNCNFEHRDR